MKYLKIIFCFFTCSSLLACNSTSQVNTSAFEHTNFVATNSDTIKKSLRSDHDLMLALLNRPMTADQAMMLAFAQQRNSQNKLLMASNRVFVDYVNIKGNKTDDNTENKIQRPTNKFSSLIANYINSIAITAPL